MRRRGRSRSGPRWKRRGTGQRPASERRGAKARRRGGPSPVRLLAVALGFLALLDELLDLLAALAADLFIELRAMALRGDLAAFAASLADRHPSAFFGLSLLGL